MKHPYKLSNFDRLARKIRQPVFLIKKKRFAASKKIGWSVVLFCFFQLRTTGLIGQINLSQFDPKHLIPPLTNKELPIIVEEETILHLVVENRLVIPEQSFTLYQNHPNPFSQETAITFKLLYATAVTLTIYDEKGKVMKEYKGEFEKGKNQIMINGKDLKEHGVLYYQVTTEDQILSKKMIYRAATK